MHCSGHTSSWTCFNRCSIYNLQTYVDVAPYSGAGFASAGPRFLNCKPDLFTPSDLFLTVTATVVVRTQHKEKKKGYIPFDVGDEVTQSRDVIANRTRRHGSNDDVRERISRRELEGSGRTVHRAGEGSIISVWFVIVVNKRK